MLDHLYQSFETTRLVVNSPDLNNLFIIGTLLCISLATLRKQGGDWGFLDRAQSDQLKGYAVLVVMLGHLWAYVAETMPVFVLGSPIELLLIVSGYGLTMSVKHSQRLSLKVFAVGRIRRMMPLYWLVTIFLLFLDFILLNRSYRWSDILLTFCGINLSIAVYHIDYVRWFITFLLVWYVIFFVAVRFLQPMGRISFLFACSLIILVVDYYLTHLGFRQVMAFPAGCAIAHYHDRIQLCFHNKTRYFLLPAFIVMGYVISSKIWFNFGLINVRPIPTVVMRALDQGGDLLFGLALVVFIAFLGLRGYYSVFLVFCGRISYELFLIHGAFLVRYNPIISQDGLPLPVQFGFFVILMMFIAFLIHSVMRKIETGLS